MKKIISFACLLLLNASFAFAQFTSYSWQNGAAENTNLPTFNLDFRGGNPTELVRAIEKASGRPLNAIINPDNQNTQIPALKMTHVNVEQLFQALQKSSQHMAMDPNTGVPYGTEYGFTTTANPPTENSVWSFFANNPPKPRIEKQCYFYSLAPFLERGFSVDDITTAIETGWKMEIPNSPGLVHDTEPALKYHKETKILMCYGTAEENKIISAVLQALPRSAASNQELMDMHNKISYLESKVNSLSVDLKASKAKPAEEKSGK